MTPALHKTPAGYNSLTTHTGTLVQKERAKENRVDFVELFSPPRVCLKARDRGLSVDDKVFDLEAGWDVRKVDHRKEFRAFQQSRRPRFLMASPECKAYSQLMNINWEKMDPQKKAAIQSEGALMWNFSLEAAETQIEAGDFFALEHPAGAESWNLESTRAFLRRHETTFWELRHHSVRGSGQISSSEHTHQPSGRLGGNLSPSKCPKNIRFRNYGKICTFGWEAFKKGDKLRKLPLT